MSAALWSQKGHSRARVLLGAVGGCVAVALLVLLGACGSTTTTTTPSGNATASGVQVQFTTAPATGTLPSITWDLPAGEPTTLDYAKAADYSPDFMISNMCDYLLRLTPDWKIQPGLAESYSNPDPTTWIYNIRPGVKFWDGHPLTAADVVYSLQRNLDPKVQPVNGGFFAYVKDIKATGPLQVTVTFKQPDELFNKEMATIAGGITEKAYAQAKGNSFGTAKGGVMYTGPYMLKSWSPGNEIVLEKNPNYWDSAYAPKVQTVNVKFIVDSSTVTSALLSGQIDGAYEVPATSIPELKTASTGALYFGPGLTVSEMVPTGQPGPMKDPELRTALGMAIDKTAIVNTVFNGAAVPNKALTPPNAWDPAAIGIYKTAYDALPSLTPDVAGAKQIVAGKSGTSKPIVLALLAGDQTELQLASVVQQAATSIGLTVKLKQMQPLDFSNAFFIPSYRKGIDLMVTFGFLDIPDPLDYLALFYGPEPIFNWINYDNPTVLNDVAKARATFDANQRATLVTQAQAQYMKDEVVIPIANNDVALFMSNKITGGPVSFAYIYLPSLALVGAK
jgi:peptide/nickel transport system substrate-binding protein